MLEINVKEARSNLSSILDRVEKGEEVIITRRGKRVARISNVANTPAPLQSLKQFRNNISVKRKIAKPNSNKSERRGTLLMVYIDTSILVAFYCPEKISDQVEDILIKTDNPAISQLTEVELTSALARKTRENALSQEDAITVLSVFRTHMDKKSYQFLPIQPKHYITAMNWIAEFNTPLRTLDALQLAIAAQNKIPLLTADIKFAKSAKSLDIEVTLIS